MEFPKYNYKQTPYLIMGIIFSFLNIIFLTLFFYTKDYLLLGILIIDAGFFLSLNPWAKVLITNKNIIEKSFYKKEIGISEIKQLSILSTQKGSRFITENDLNKNPFGINQILVSKVYYKNPPEKYFPIPDYNYIIFDYSEESYNLLKKLISTKA